MILLVSCPVKESTRKGVEELRNREGRRDDQEKYRKGNDCKICKTRRKKSKAIKMTVVQQAICCSSNTGPSETQLPRPYCQHSQHDVIA